MPFRVGFASSRLQALLTYPYIKDIFRELYRMKEVKSPDRVFFEADKIG